MPNAQTVSADDLKDELKLHSDLTSHQNELSDSQLQQQARGTNLEGAHPHHLRDATIEPMSSEQLPTGNQSVGELDQNNAARDVMRHAAVSDAIDTRMLNEDHVVNNTSTSGLSSPPLSSTPMSSSPMSGSPRMSSPPMSPSVMSLRKEDLRRQISRDKQRAKEIEALLVKDCEA